MQVLVLIEPISTGYRATGPFQITGEGETTEAALEQLRSKIADLNKRGASLVMLDVPLGTAWLPQPVERSPEEEQVWQEWREIMAERRQREAEEEADI